MICRFKPAGSPYRQKVWAALRQIPAGETRSYAEIARVAGGSPRSVGGANAANPIPILIPCHRVLGSAGLGGYSGGEGWRPSARCWNLEKLQSGSPRPMTKAIRIHAVGGPEVLKWEQVPTPQPGPAEALVHHEAVGLNYIDVYFRSGLYKAPLPATIGMEGAGVVRRGGR